MKIKIVQFYCGKNQVYNQLVNQVKDLNSNYCYIHNYDYQLRQVDEKQVQQFINSNNFRWNINAYKFKVIYEQLIQSDCDYLVYMDADAAISKPQIKIEDLIDNEHDLFFSRSDSKHDQKTHMIDLAQKMNAIFQKKLLDTNYFDEFTDAFCLFYNFERLMIGYLFMNEGFMVIKNDNLMKDFFKDANDLVPYFNDLKFNTMTTDGRIVHFLTLRNKYKDCWKFMYDQAQGSHASINEAKYDEDKTFVLHDYQVSSFEERLAYMKNLKENKWWKGVI